MWAQYEVSEVFRINEMYSLFEADYRKGYEFPGESHNFWECVYVIDGEIETSGDDKVYNMKTHQIIFHKPLEVHKFSVLSEKGAQLLTFSFDTDVNMQFFENKAFLLNSSQTDIINSMLKFLHKNNEVQIPSISGTGDLTPLSMYLDKFTTDFAYSQSVVSYIYQLFLSLSNNSTISSASQNEETKIFSDAVNYMNENIFTFPSISEIAKSCGTSQTNLKKIFSKLSGLGVHKYFTTLKINTSKQLLADGLTGTQIAERLGFSSQAYFSSVFKRETGMTITQYKSIR